MKNLLGLIICFVILTSCASQQKIFQKTKEENTIEAYKIYIEKYPESEFSKEAEENIVKLELEKAEKENTIIAYRNFIKEHPNNHQSKIAEKNIQIIEEIKNSSNENELKNIFKKNIEIINNESYYNFKFLKLWLDALSKEIPNKPADFLTSNSDTCFLNLLFGFTYLPTKPKSEAADEHLHFFEDVLVLNTLYSNLFSDEYKGKHLYESAYLSHNLAKFYICVYLGKTINEFYDFAKSFKNFQALSIERNKYLKKQIFIFHSAGYLNSLNKTSVYSKKKMEEIGNTSLNNSKDFNTEFFLTYDMLHLSAKNEKEKLKNSFRNKNLDSKTKQFIETKLSYWKNIFPE